MTDAYHVSMASPRRLLVRLFVQRLLDNDLIAPGGERHAGATLALALLAVPAFFHLAWVVFAYSNPFLTPSERLLLALDHKTQFITCSMLAAALTAVIEWDALSIDARDLAILGPLPVSARMLWEAKALSLLVLVALVAFAVNVVPTFLFPPVWLMLVPIGLLRLLSVVAVHALTSVGAAVFGFSAVLATRSVLMLVCGPRLFRFVTPVVQFVLVLGLAAGFFLLPRYSCDAAPRIRRQPAAMAALPPMWFVGIYDRLTSPGLYGDPDLTRDHVWRFWERERMVYTYKLLKIPGRLPEAWVHPTPLFKWEADARKQYQAVQPTLDRYARIGFRAFPTMILASVALYALACRTHRQQMVEASTPHAGVRLFTRLVWAGMERVAAGSQVTKGIALFTLKGIGRSGSHRFYTAASLAAGCSVAFGMALTAASRWNDLLAPAPALLSMQFVVVSLLVLGLRAALAVPVDLNANWVFRLTCAGNAAEVAAGVRHAIAAVAVVLLACLAPLHAALWGWAVASMHMVAGVAATLTVIELVLLGHRKAPFACAPETDYSMLTARLAAAVLGGGIFAWVFGWVESHAIARPWGYLGFIAALLASAAAARVVGKRVLAAGAVLSFDDTGGESVQALRLTE
ncbi:MAG: hypothetical protein ACM3NQ_01555 [Bacteroidales bacterium]